MRNSNLFLRLERAVAGREIRNAAWSILEKVVSAFGLIFVTSFVARYIGPSVFGMLTLAAAIFQVTQILAQLGSDSVVFKRSSRNAQSGARLVSATATLRVSIYLLAALPVLIFFIWGQDRLSVVLFSAACAAALFSAWDAYSIYNGALLRARLNAITNVFGLVVGLALRYCIAALELNPEWLAVPIILTTFIPFIVRRNLFLRQSRPVLNGRNERRYVYYLLSAGGTIALSSISIAVYTRIGQFMVSGILGVRLMGVYAAALTIATSWSFVNASLVNSFFPAIYSERDEKKAVQRAAGLSRAVGVFCIIVTLVFSAFGAQLIEFLYGVEYVGAYVPGIILCASVGISALGTISYRYIIRHSGYRFLSMKMVAVLLVSVAIYYPLVKLHGIVGAAVGVLLTELLSLTVLNYLFKRGIIFNLHRRIFGI